MSNALTKASRLKPEIRLAQAVSEFEADLADDQKCCMRNFRSDTLSATPTLRDVMRITAEIDRRTSAQVSHRCLGPRFLNILQSVQQFVALCGTAVGGTQNIIACGVFSAVRVSILAIINNSTYSQDISMIFMKIGQSAPLNERLALLYPESKIIQSHLCEYFIVVVQLCHHLVRVSKQMILFRIASTLNDTRIKNFQADLDHWAGAIRDEANLTGMQESSKFRTRFRVLSKAISEQERIAAKLRVLDICSTFDYQTPWKQIRKTGNSSCFSRLAEYNNWRDTAGSCTLLCEGKLGSGKSVVLSNIVDDLNLHSPEGSFVVAYFFCRHDILQSLESRTILGSLARQILQTVSDLTALDKTCQRESLHASSEDIVDLISHAFHHDRKIFVVLDGIDECTDAEREVVLKQLAKVQKSHNLSLCLSSRTGLKNEAYLVTECFPKLSMVSVPCQSDIEAFIDADLDGCCKDGRLKLGHPALILEIRQALLDGAEGMFLWVVLQIKWLCQLNTDHAIREALSSLPKGLPETYARILRSSSSSNLSDQVRILKLITAACRPLTTDELREALSVSPGDTRWDPSKILNDTGAMLASCGCLVIIDEEELTVRFIHQSVKQYILSGQVRGESGEITLKSAQTEIADIVVTYLGYDVFGTQLVKRPAHPEASHAILSGVMQSTLHNSKAAQTVARKLLEFRKKAPLDLTRALAEAQSYYRARPPEQFYFHRYAKSHWWNHLSYMSAQDETIFRLIRKLLQYCDFELNEEYVKVWSLCSQCVGNGQRKIVDLLLESGRVNDTSRTADGLTMSLWAAQTNQIALIEMLRDSSKFNPTATNHKKQSQLILASQSGHEGVVKLLLAAGKADVNITDQDDRTALIWASRKGHEGVVKLLLATGKADVNITDQYSLTALIWASLNRDEGVVKLLLAIGKADVNITDQDGRTALIWASLNGDEGVVKLLLATGKADVNITDKDSLTALVWASQNGDEGVVKLLLATGKANVNITDKNGKTALIWASQKGHERVVRLLLATGKADVNITNKNGETALMWASQNGDEGVVKLLLATGKANVNITDQFGRTPLIWASNNGHEGVVKLLLATGKADVYISKEDGLTALIYASKKGHEGVVKPLQATGEVKVDPMRNKGYTAIDVAVSQGKRIVQLLKNDGVYTSSEVKKQGRN